MFVKVDAVEAEQVEGYIYVNEDGDEEKVTLCPGGGVVIEDSTGGSVTIFGSDVPKLIKALELAQNHQCSN